MQHFTCIMTILLSVNTRMQSGVKLSSPFIEQAKRPVKTSQTIDDLELLSRIKTSMATECVFMHLCQF